jgi:hypothetical protein
LVICTDSNMPHYIVCLSCSVNYLRKQQFATISSSVAFNVGGTSYY